tara:strand:- start:140 stop:403 length:264 start_codon:yes stop_codon:yes gene_type:complete
VVVLVNVKEQMVEQVDQVVVEVQEEHQLEQEILLLQVQHKVKMVELVDLIVVVELEVVELELQVETLQDQKVEMVEVVQQLQSQQVP